ncbi:ice-binding family protein [Streptomyces sp. NPDC059479]|uniref:ice-binding family protein n=1 Tax=Streptomyces sp. NPDC059479 TaxID=3346848 RepID=UPI00368E4717
MSTRPPVTAVTLDSGPVDDANLVVITGTAFSYATGVTFDGTPALPLRVASDIEIDAVVPAGSLGLANVSVTTLGGTTTATDAYTYLELLRNPGAAGHADLVTTYNDTVGQSPKASISGDLEIGLPLSNVLLINGAIARNVIWQIGSSATLGTGSDSRKGFWLKSRSP